MPGSARLFATALFALSVSGTTKVLAGDPGAGSDSRAPRPPPAGSASSATATASVEPSAAELSYDRAIAFYAAGDKASALAAMRESFRLSRHPDLLYNVAKLEHELGQCQASLRDYREYSKLAPSAAYHDAALRAEVELTKTCGSPTSPPTSSGYWTTSRILGWSAIAAGAVAGSAAVYFALSADSAQDDVQRMVQTHVKAGDSWSQLDHERELDAQRGQTAATVSAILAGSLAAAGIILVVMPGRGEQPPSNVSVSAQPGGGLLGYSRRF